MKDLIIGKSKSSPEVNFNARSGILSIIGHSYPENSNEFYQQVLQWVQTYFDDCAKKKTTINIKLIYLNSSSSEAIFRLFEDLNLIKDTHQVEINWLFDKENEYAEELGQEYIEDFEHLTINLVTT